MENGEDKSVQETAPASEPDMQKIKETTEKLDRAVYEKRSAELKEIEARIDKKMKDFRELAEDVERQGITTAGQKVEKVDPVKAAFDSKVKAIMAGVGR